MTRNGKYDTIPFMLNEVELAWAAGFFDGEGSTSLAEGRKPKLTIAQKYPECLERFRLAVGTGSIHGPYYPPSNDGHQIYRFQIQRGQDVLDVLHKLWPYLSVHKKEQAEKCGFRFKHTTIFVGRKHGPKRKVSREEWLAHNHLSRQELAKKFGVSPSTISGWRYREKTYKPVTPTIKG